jgi:uncharacterized protein (TIGR03663 family)
VATASTKSGRKKSQRANAKAGRSVARNVEQLADEEILTQRNWRIASLAILLVGTILRLYDLSLVPLHHDEGVNGNFLLTLVRNGSYQYNPENYHGPTLYFFSAVIPWIFGFLGGKDFGNAHGLTTFNIRLVTAAFGVGTIGLALLLRSRVGTIGALSAAALIAISPGAVYLSRYFIHESLFVFFTLGIVVAALKYYDTARPSYLILASISAALMVATKETWIINGPVLLIALVTTTAYFWLREKFFEKHGAVNDSAQTGLNRFGGPVPLITVSLVALAIFVMVNVLFYSSFFTNYPKGVHDALSTLNMWRHRTTEHWHPWSQYLDWLREEELPVLLLGAAGALAAVWRSDNRFAVFMSQFAFGLLAAYSLVGYKTPWITLNFIVPLAIVGGYALNLFYRKLVEFDQAPVFIAMAVVIVAFLGYQMYELNFVHYDDDRYAYVYAHTRRETLGMIAEIDRVAKQSGSGKDTGIAILSPDYWPLPWYFRDYDKALFYGQISPTTEPVVIGSVGQESQLDAELGDRYKLISSGSEDKGWALRPGVDLLLYVRRDVAPR